MRQREDNNKSVKYLSNSNFDELWGLTVNTVGHQNIEAHKPYPTQNHPNSYLFSTEKGRILDEYQFLYVARGEGSFVSKSCKEIKIRTGNLFFLFPNEWHNFSPNEETGWEEYWIGFKGADIDRLCENGFFNKSKPVFNIGYNNTIIELFDQAIKATNERETGLQQMLAGLVKYMLGIIYSINKQSFFDEQTLPVKIEEAKKIMKDNFHLNISPADIADRLCLSYSHFRKIFKEYTGYAPKQYIMELKINKSKELLTTTNMYLKEISHSAGFENVEYFCSLFKKNVGISPAAYRNKTKE
ncbi:MAG: AraC family transcriptional regulator [Dysgonamonadaceae bacterium]|jgi:AraC-like DNA-binding protein|nr:AraC family transcriptional regulator [Dysgonamonadaceae bacterium]